MKIFSIQQIVTSVLRSKPRRILRVLKTVNISRMIPDHEKNIILVNKYF